MSIEKNKHKRESEGTLQDFDKISTGAAYDRDLEFERDKANSNKYYNRVEPELEPEADSNKYYNRVTPGPGVDNEPELYADIDADLEDDLGQESKREFNVKSLYKFPAPIIAVLLYLLSGLFLGIWHPTWLIILTIPLYYQLVATFSTKNFRKRLYRFPMPVSCTLLFLFIGTAFDVWHPTWILFLLIPIYYMLIPFISSNSKIFKKLFEKLFGN